MRGGVGLADHYRYVVGIVSEAASGPARAYPLEISPGLPEPRHAVIDPDRDQLPRRVVWTGAATSVLGPPRRTY